MLVSVYKVSYQKDKFDKGLPMLQRIGDEVPPR